MAVHDPPHGQAPGAELPAPEGPDGAVLDVYNDGYGAGLFDRPGAGVRRGRDVEEGSGEVAGVLPQNHRG